MFLTKYIIDNKYKKIYNVFEIFNIRSLEQ